MYSVQPTSQHTVWVFQSNQMCKLSEALHYKIAVYFYAYTATGMVPEAYCIQVCPSVVESVHPIENLVNMISQKPMKGISPSFGHRYICVHSCAD